VLGIIPKETNWSKEVAPGWEHRTVWCAPNSVRCLSWLPRRTGRSQEKLARRGYNSPECLVCTGLSGEPAAPTPTIGSPISERRRVDFANGHQAAPDCPVCHQRRGCNSRLCQERKEISYCLKLVKCRTL
jgi:hypothetical protein